ncbi:cytochrome P450 [Xylaria acuta]|nr:cytochrome P450 [Xylaria acuta]
MEGLCSLNFNLIDFILMQYQTEPKVPDVMGHLLAPYKSNKTWDDAAIDLMARESHLLMNAGSDTTRTTLASALLKLAKHPEYAKKLREALEPHVSQTPDAEIHHDKISILEILDGVIWEALRLFPPNPSHPTRVTPAEGAMIADERIYPRATEFIPERWSSSPYLVKDKKATAPFSIGPYNCIGKPLAMMNVRVTPARIIMRYDFRS